MADNKPTTCALAEDAFHCAVNHKTGSSLCRGCIVGHGQFVRLYANDKYLEGYFGLQIHSGNAGKVLWRKLQVKEL